MDENELLEKILWINPGGQRGRGRPKSRWIDVVEEDARKLCCRNWPRIEVADDICLRRPGPTQGCTAYDDNDDVDHFRIVDIIIIVDLQYFTWVHCLIRSSQRRFLFSENDRMKLKIRGCLKLRKKIIKPMH
jgi:hypothetical protein